MAPLRPKVIITAEKTSSDGETTTFTVADSHPAAKEILDTLTLLANATTPFHRAFASALASPEKTQEEISELIVKMMDDPNLTLFFHYAPMTSFAFYVTSGVYEGNPVGHFKINLSIFNVLDERPSRASTTTTQTATDLAPLNPRERNQSTRISHRWIMIHELGHFGQDKIYGTKTPPGKTSSYLLSRRTERAHMGFLMEELFGGDLVCYWTRGHKMNFFHLRGVAFRIEEQQRFHIKLLLPTFYDFVIATLDTPDPAGLRNHLRVTMGADHTIPGVVRTRLGEEVDVETPEGGSHGKSGSEREREASMIGEGGSQGGEEEEFEITPLVCGTK